MKISYRLCLVIIGLSIIGSFSCNTSKNEPPARDQTLLSPLDEIVTLTLDSVSPHFSSPPQLFQDKATDSTYLLVKNHLFRSIDFYSFPSGMLIRRVIPEVEGQNGVGELTGFQVLNRDSILIISHYEFSISIIDWNAKLINKLYAPSKTINLRVDGNKQATLLDSILHVPFEDFTNYGMVEGFTRNINTMYRINLNDGSFTSIVGYPSVYQDKLTSMYFIKQYSITFPYPGKNLFIISYPLYSNLVLVKNEVIDSTKSASIGEFHPIRPVNFELVPPEHGNHETHFYGNFSYGKIAYDESNKVYYRLVWHPAKELNLMSKDYDEAFENITSKRAFSIIVLNEEFEKIGEQKFSQPHHFDPNMSFVADGGLHIYEKSDNPDEMRFRVFKLSINETTG